MEDNRENIWEQEDESSLKLIDIWHMIWDHKWWYVASVFLALVLAVFYLYRSPSFYSRTAKVIIDEGSQESALRDLASFTGASTRRYATNVDNEVEAFASPDLMQTVVERLGLQTSYYEHQLLRKVELGPSTPIEMSLAGNNPQSGFSFTLYKLDDSSFEIKDYTVKGEKLDEKPVKGSVCDTVTTPVGRIVITPVISDLDWSKPITVSWSNARSCAKKYVEEMSIAISGKQTSVVVLSIKDKFPSRAENVINTLIDVYDESWILNKNRSARLTTEFINDRLVVIEQELGGIETDLKQFKERNNVTDIKAVGNAYLQESTEFGTRAFEVNNQISIAKYIRDYLNDPANSHSLIPANSGISNSNVESQISEYNKLILDRDRMLSSSSEKNPLVTDLNSSLAAMRSSILRSIDNLISTLELENSQIKSQENLILKKMASSTGQEFEILSIERQQKVKESLYIYLLQKREENEIASLVNVANTRLIMSPNGSPNPVEPRSMVILFIACVLGCAIPFAFFFLKKMLDTTVTYKDDVTSALSMPYLGEIPLVGKQKRFRLRKKILIDDKKRRVMVKAGKRNAINEAFRVVRTNVDMMLAGDEGHKVIMLSSFYPGSGKTFVSINMAAIMAIKGSKVALVDLDLRKASLSTALGNVSEGVAAYLSGSIESLDSCVEQLKDNLDVIKVGKLPPNPAELLLSDRFKNMMAELREKYDYVFLDCPPVEIVADSSIITSHVDMTIFIVRSGLMDKRVLPLVEELYQSNKYTRMTLILNGVPSVSKYGYAKYGYGKYGYGSGYGYTYGDVYGQHDPDEE